jgi:hemolysin III
MTSLPSFDADELANSITHAIGLILSIFFTFKLVQRYRLRGRRQLVGSIVFGCSLIILYGMSTLYHGVTHPNLKHILRYGDHIAIFLLIAGTYTPITLGPLWASCGKRILIIIWSMAAVGIFAKLFFFNWFSKISLTYFIGMGWVIVISLRDLAQALSKGAVAWLVIGGVAYTAGCHFFKKDTEVPFYHAVWHLFVLLGSGAHGICILTCV